MEYRLCPSILSADFNRLGEQIKILEKEGVEYLHIDVMDGDFVPSISFGMPVILSLIHIYPDKNIITRALGAEKTVDVDFFDLKLEKGCTILMCSDGLSNMVEDEKIQEIISDPEADIDQKGSALLREANQNGGKDNIAVVLVEPFTNEVEAC